MILTVRKVRLVSFSSCALSHNALSTLLAPWLQYFDIDTKPFIMKRMSSHHAVLFSASEPLVVSLDGYENVAAHNQYRQRQFSIDDVRTLISVAYRRPEADEAERVLLVATEFITEEAQQALLKLIEEPPLSTRFIFVLPEGYLLLPTLESRFKRAGSLGQAVIGSAFAIFEKASLAERLTLIEENLKRKDQVWQADIKKGLLAYLTDRSHSLSVSALSDLEYVSRLLLTRGASNKMLLEQLALTVPA